MLTLTHRMWTAFCRVIKNSKLPWTAQYELPIYMYFDPLDIWYRDESVLIVRGRGQCIENKIVDKRFLVAQLSPPMWFSVGFACYMLVPLDSLVTSPYIRRHQINMKLVNFVDIWILHIFLWKPPLCVL